MNDTERDTVRLANAALQRWMNKYSQGLMPEQEMPAGTKMNKRSRLYRYWESPDQRMFCYTPWKDANGDYWTWVMKPVGRGARSGKATRWKRVGKRVRSRTRRTARKRAETRYRNWLQYLEGPP